MRVLGPHGNFPPPTLRQPGEKMSVLNILEEKKGKWLIEDPDMKMEKFVS